MFEVIAISFVSGAMVAGIGALVIFTFMEK